MFSKVASLEGSRLAHCLKDAAGDLARTRAMATTTTNEAEQILASAKALVQDYTAKGPARSTLTFWERAAS